MSNRVLATAEAQSAINQMQSIINGGLADQVAQLDSQGRTLSDPNVWDGPLADTFRNSTWPGAKAALDKTKHELEELRGQLDQIRQNIMQAGGA